MNRLAYERLPRMIMIVTISLLCGYVLVGLVAFLGQRGVMYPIPPTTAVPTYGRGKLIVLEGAAGRRVHAYHVPVRDDSPTVVIFHGNAEQLADQMSIAEDFADADLGAYAIEYPGYGLSSDSETTENNVYADAEAALLHLELRLNVSRSNLVLFGRSLGTGVAVEMATRGFGNRLILVSPFSSMLNLARNVAPFLPTRWLVLDRYDTLAKASAIRQPTLIIHGVKDSVVPCDMGKAVAARIPGAEIRILPDADHNDVFLLGGETLWQSIVGFARGSQPAASMPASMPR